jgi:hypothetical protein
MAPGVILSITYFMAVGLTSISFIIERRKGQKAGTFKLVSFAEFFVYSLLVLLLQRHTGIKRTVKNSYTVYKNQLTL